jgi:hypothetical protein
MSLGAAARVEAPTHFQPYKILPIDRRAVNNKSICSFYYFLFSLTLLRATAAILDIPEYIGTTRRG